MQQDLAELTVRAVQNIYGAAVASIYAVLAYHGRQSLREIIKHTQLSLPQVKSNLVVLIQYHLVLHSTSDDDDRTQYTANCDATYNIAFRYSKYENVLRQRFGHDALELRVFQTIARRGHARISDVLEEIGLPRNGHLQNGKLTGSAKSPAERPLEKPVARIHRATHSLLRTGYLRLVTIRDYNTISELIRDSEIETGVEREKGKEKQAVIEQARRLREVWRDEALIWVDDGDSPRPLKRQKRHRSITNGVQHAYPSDGLEDDNESEDDATTQPVPEGLVMRINFEKCNLQLRNQQLVTFAHRFVGETTSKVFEALLLATEDQQLRCYNNLEKPEVLRSRQEDRIRSTPDDIAKYLDPAIDLNVGLQSERITNGMNGHAQNNKTAHKPHHPHNSESDESDIPQASKKRKQPDQSMIHMKMRIEAHLKLLAADPRHFVKYNYGYSIPFKSLTRQLIQHELETTIVANYGPLAARLIRILHANYSTDEKDLASKAILKPKEVRSATTELVKAGLLSTQEVPRDTNRTTNRLLWLYTWDPSIARKTLIINTHRSMVRLLVRMDKEKREIAALVEKAERTDVVGHEEELLSVEERSILDKFHDKEEALLVQVLRLDDIVACLRDFSPLDDPYVGNRKRPPQDDDVLDAEGGGVEEEGEEEMDEVYDEED